MSYIFSKCLSIEMLDLSSFNTDKTNNMKFMFYECISLKKIKISSHFNTKNILKDNIII